MIPKFDVLAIGELNPDMILSGIDASRPELGTEQAFDTQLLTLGSSTAIACVLMQRLGLRTALCALIGDDYNGRFCLDVLEREGVDFSDVQVRPGSSTGITISLSYDQDRLLLTRYGTMTVFDANCIRPSLLQETRHIHCGSFYIQSALQPDLSDIFRTAQLHGLTTSLDLGWDPSNHWDTQVLAEVLPYTNVVLPNLVELLTVTGTTSIDDGLSKLHQLGASEIAVKLGSDGSLVSIDGVVTRHPGFSITPTDTTGAGDAFNAGYLYARLSKFDIPDRLALGNACGAIIASANGGTGGLQDMAEAIAFMQHQATVEQ